MQFQHLISSHHFDFLQAVAEVQRQMGEGGTAPEELKPDGGVIVEIKQENK